MSLYVIIYTDVYLLICGMNSILIYYAQEQSAVKTHTYHFSLKVYSYIYALICTISHVFIYICLLADM